MRRVIVLALVVAAVAIVWSLRRTERTPHAVGPQPAVVERPAAAASALEEIAAPAPQSEPARALAPVEPAAIAPAPDAVPAVASTLCELKGKFTLEGGAPARGVTLGVHGWQANNERVMKYGMPEQWDEPTGESQADGSFSIRFDPPRAYQFVLNAQLPGWCKTSWRWSEIEPHKTVDVGTVELVRGGSIRGSVVDAQGRALTKGWQVYAEAFDGDRSSDREDTRVNGAVDATTGDYVLEGLPTGRVRLKAYSRIANWIEGPLVDVRAGEESKADIEYTGPDNESRIVVITFSRPFYVFHDVAEIRLSGPGIDTRTAKQIEHSSQSFSFDDLPPGSYTVEIHDPRFEPWSRTGVQPGVSVDARLKGSAAVSLQVLDENGRPAPRYALDVRFEKVNFSPSTFRVWEAKDEPPASGLFDGLIPHDQTLIVHVDGYAPCEVSIPELKAGETRAAVARLSRGERVAGRVVEGGEMKPLAEATVVLTREREDEGQYFGGSEGLDTREQASGPDGRFAFEQVPVGKWEIRASRGPLFTVRHALAIAAGSSVPEFNLALPEPAYLAGKLLGPKGASFEGLRVQALPVTEDEDEGERMRDILFFARGETAISISEAGTFRIGPLPVGEIAVNLRMPDIAILSENGSSGFDGQTIDLGKVVLTAGADTTREFDISSQFPGTIAVRVRVNGEPAASHLVLVNEAGEYRTTAGSIRLDAQGYGRSGPIKPGTYSFLTRPLDSAWIDQSGAQRTLAPGQSIELAIDVQLVTGTLIVVDATTNAPLANGNVSLQYDQEHASASVRATTDAQGRARLALPLGRYRVTAGTMSGFFHPDATVVVDWTTTGPLPAELRIKPYEFPK